MRRLIDRFPYALKLDWRPEGVDADAPRFPATHTAVSDADLIAGFVADLRGSSPTASEQALILQALAAASRAEAAA
jgi:exonuclease SbcD